MSRSSSGPGRRPLKVFKAVFDNCVFPHLKNAFSEYKLTNFLLIFSLPQITEFHPFFTQNGHFLDTCFEKEF